MTVDRTQARKTDFRYDEHGNLVQTIRNDGSYTLSRYDSRGRVIAEMQPVDASVTAVWSDPDNSYIVSGSSPVQTIPTRLFEFDSQGRLSAVELPAVPDPDNANTLTRPRYEYGYNEQGNQTLIKDPLGRETRFVFDSQGRQLTRTLPLGFGPDGIQGTGDDGTLPEGAFNERFEYDNQGRQNLHVSFEGAVTQMVYDDTATGGGRLKEQRFYPDEATYNGGAGTPSETWSYFYDAYGRTIEVRKTEGTTTTSVKTTYDDQGRVTVIDSAEGVISYGYDSLGRKTEMKVFATGVDPNTAMPERVTTYGYDLLGRLKTVSEDLDPTSSSDTPLDTTYAYDLLGNLDRTDLPNGVITDYQYDDLNRLDVMTQYAPDATPEDLSDNDKLAEFDYTVRADGKRTGVTETFWLDEDNDPSTPATPHVNTITWNYDDVGRLVDEVFDHFDDSFDQSQQFVYDLVGNRKSVTTDRGNDSVIDEAITYLYDANDRLTTESLDSDNNGAVDQTTSYAYAHTQQTGKTVVDNSSGNTTSNVSFSYDLQGRMSQVITETLTGGAVTQRERVTYEYSSSGIKTSALYETDADADGTYETSTKTEYLSDPSNFTGYSQVLKETKFDASGNVIQTIEYTIGHDEIAQTVTDYDPASGLPTQVSRLVFGHDGHGTVRVLFDMARAIAQVFAFEAYGALTAIHNGSAGFVSSSAADALTNILYSGEPFDAKIGQQYLRARWYDPATGRFNRLDPFFGNLQDPQSLHKYLYVHGDPVQGVDPSGEFSLSGSVASMGIGSNMRATNSSAVYATGTRVLWRLVRHFALSRLLIQLQTLNQHVVQLPRAKVRRDYDYALLSQAAYETADLSTVRRRGWRDRIDVGNAATGFFARLFERNGERVLAYAGTTTVSDWIANIQQGLFADTSQYREAVSLVESLERQFGRIDRFVGHSLGGGLATAAAVVYRRSATTFNASGVHPDFVARYGATLAGADRFIDAYRVQGEILSTIQDTNLAWYWWVFYAGVEVGLAGALAPDSVGKSLWLEGTGLSAVRRHLMPQVLSGMQRMM